MNASFKTKLKSYSAIAVSTIALNKDSEATILYTDIPDRYLTGFSWGGHGQIL